MPGCGLVCVCSSACGRSPGSGCCSSEDGSLESRIAFQEVDRPLGTGGQKIIFFPNLGLTTPIY